MARLKRTDSEPPPAEILADEEPRYLRRQRPVEVRRQSLGRRLRENWLVWLKWLVIAATGGAAVFAAAHFFLFSPQVILADSEQVELTGNQFVPRSAVLEVFAADQGRSVLRVPLEERRVALERIAWVEQARVARVLPNRLHVELVERRPVAFLRTGSELALVDVHGVILDRPPQGDFRFPVVTGLSEAMPRPERERRMQLFAQFEKDIESVRAGAAGQLSEVDLRDSSDLRATLASVPDVAPSGDGPQALLVHFGSGDFAAKFKVLLENYTQWRFTAGRVESVDLRFRKQVVVNPELKQPAPGRDSGTAGSAKEQKQQR